VFIMAESKADSRLAEQLTNAELHNDPLQAWFTLRPDQASLPVPSPERTKKLADELIDRVTRSTGEGAHAVKVLDQLGSFQVQAPPSFIRALSTQPEVASSRSTHLPGLELIRPVPSSLPPRRRSLPRKRQR
jgi:hypothetical protein